MLLPYLNENLIEAGCDEAGRGCLAGAVYAAAVILPKDFKNELLNDSKQLTEKQRYALREVIEKEAIAWAVGIVSPEEIDEINILNATKKALHMAISNLKVKPDRILVDALEHIDTYGIPYTSIIKGDAKIYSISVASIIAKVTRDRIMQKYDEIYPEYGFSGHKGYGTAKHIQAIKEYGPCSLHRKTFIKKFV